MKAIAINQYGSADVLKVMELPEPELRPDGLKVKIHAASVNPIDWKLRQGQLKLLSGSNFPKILGSDLAGEVVACGDRITTFKPGDEIYAFLNPLAGGAYAEYAMIPEAIACFKPKNLNYSQAAAVPLAATTALQALRDLGNLQGAQDVLINGASGGVGSFAVQIAKAFGARVTGVCSSRNFELMEALNCDRMIDYKAENFTQLPEKYDLIFDAVGQKTFRQCKRVLKRRGLYISTLPSPQTLIQVALTSFLPGKTCKLVLAQSRGSDLAYLQSLIETEQVKPVCDRVFPLAETADAHRYSETKRAVGKIIIAVIETDLRTD
ncbi:MAG: NAD(P)-dependent alcohol dehydrogenase [Leptolyngbyaceae cyanobacterium SM1_1_3]|nr:NAD(P)-dependent alcohol dehydrogenase [Leptolyngbyaceae cyanobacterium SM1_1_3]NJN02411.1 NAD(P)-dependent alcohol dehydrogenase [Leptolyngbyaceae cyanobacterium RM1_1_2]NJO11082.1 NAD(P)-dependent alcohol dehydrogenase [Leptolyngbyaceae cyanobacterium SL_1_1]